MNEFMKRLNDEFFELGEKLSKLEEFLDSNKTRGMSTMQFSYLRIQRDAMKTYHTILNDRIVDLKKI